MSSRMLVNLSWPSKVGTYELPSDELHLWAMALDKIDQVVTTTDDCLSVAERARAERFVCKRAQKNFIAARLCLRTLLALYKGCTATELIFEENVYGKPHVVAPLGKTIHFNLSHSHDLLLLAFSTQGVVGVDVECLERSCTNLEALVERYWTAEEYLRWQSVEKDNQQLTFLSSWTRKEAIVKAVGVGLHYPLAKIGGTMFGPHAASTPNNSTSNNDQEPIEVTLAEEPTCSISNVQNNMVVYSFFPARNYVGAVATIAPTKIKYYSLPPSRLQLAEEH